MPSRHKGQDVLSCHDERCGVFSPLNTPDYQACLSAVSNTAIETSEFSPAHLWIDQPAQTPEKTKRPENANRTRNEAAVALHMGSAGASADNGLVELFGAGTKKRLTRAETKRMPPRFYNWGAHGL